MYVMAQNLVMAELELSRRIQEIPTSEEFFAETNQAPLVKSGLGGKYFFLFYRKTLSLSDLEVLDTVRHRNASSFIRSYPFICDLWI